MEKPIRVQRKRAKGYKLPENTISVTRPSKWGNPFKIGDEIPENWLSNEIKFNEPLIKPDKSIILDRENCINIYRKWVTETDLSKDLHELKGKNLACFCNLSDKCHVDVLLELANGK
jgi:hypothetical protein